MIPRQTSLALCACFIFLSCVRGEEPATRHNPYLELGSRFEFVDTGDPVVDWNPERSWRSKDGRLMEGTIVGTSETTATFQLADNRQAEIPLERFSERDRRFIREWQQVSLYFNPGYGESRDVTNTVEAGIADGAFARQGKVHATRNFRFECDVVLNAATVRDFSRMFEATYNVIRALPFGIQPDRPPQGKFKVRLFSDIDDYHRAGGPVGAAGVYILKSREILVPLESLGIGRSGQTYRKTSEYEPSTLIHEITHAVTHHWLNFVPMWFTEGLADYVGAIPYREGTFYLDRHDHGIYQMVARNFGGDALRFRILRPEEFIYLDKDEFMNRPSEPEKEVELTAIKPFQIRLTGDPEVEDNASPSSSPTSKTPSATPAGASPEPVNNSSIVVQRYSSSMVLLDHLIRGGQASQLRKYLFANFHFEWDAEKYIADYNQSLVDYQEAVRDQINDFDHLLESFNSKVRAYNAAVRKRNAGESVPLPVIPEQPTAPKPVVVPEILAEPRSSRNFSRNHFRRESIDTFLNVPKALGL